MLNMEGVAVWLLLVTFASSIIGLRIKPVPLIEVEKDVQIDLYTLENIAEPQILIVNDTNSITKSNYNPENPTRIFIHGFQSRGGLKNVLTDAYFLKAQYDINLIGINWERVSNTINYPAAKKNTPEIGQYTARFIDFMVENKMLKLSNLTVIGFSLGAHVAGFTGKSLKSGRLSKIVGLDPASVLFPLDDPQQRLHSSDATYVETIQTSKLGFIDPIGTVSFYPNGGRIQPGCSWDDTGACSHSTAYKYFAQSIYLGVPFFGDFCQSLADVQHGTCNRDQQAELGGEPGAVEQPAGMYHIRLIPDPDVK